FQVPDGSGSIYVVRRRGESYFCLTPGIVFAAIGKAKRILGDLRLEVCSASAAGDAADLKDVNKIHVICHFESKLHLLKVEVLESEMVKKNVAGKELVAANVDCVLRKVKRIAQ